MPLRLNSRLLTALALTLSLLCIPALADQIVLKNGRKILASNVIDLGDKIQYDTSAGQLSLPKSLVDHIVKGGFVPSDDSPAAQAANLDIAPPQVASSPASNEIDHFAVHDGEIDRDYISKAENEARGGSAQANQRAALAHLAAAQFELAHGDLDHALTDSRTALTYQPDEAALLLNVGYLYLRRSEYREALDYLDRAKRVAPQSADVYKLSGWAYFGLNRLDLAVSEWKKAVELRPDPDVVAALDKAQRDKAEEDSYRQNESAHFQLRYNGAAEPNLAREVLHTLEHHYDDISSALNYSPPEPIGVILYTQQSFADITQAPGWVGALNDGRIRVPVQGLTSVDPALSRVLRHELTHSFINQKTHGHVPTWIQEGVAQYMEGKRSDQTATALIQIYNEGQAVSLTRLEGSWMSMSSDVARYCYAWSLAVVEYIVQTQGMDDIARILDKLASGNSTDAAVHDVLRDSLDDLSQATADYLKKNYEK